MRDFKSTNEMTNKDSKCHTSFKSTFEKLYINLRRVNMLNSSKMNEIRNTKNLVRLELMSLLRVVIEILTNV